MCGEPEDAASGLCDQCLFAAHDLGKLPEAMERAERERERRRTAIGEQTRAAGVVTQAVAGLPYCPVCRADDLWEDRECCPTGVAVGRWEAAAVAEAVAGR